MVWSTDSYGILTTSKAASPIHCLKWDPYTVNEFSSVGQNGTVLFWLLDETATNICLNVHEAEVPDDLLRLKHGVTMNKTSIWASSRQNLSSGFPTKRVSNQSPRLQGLARKLKFHL